MLIFCTRKLFMVSIQKSLSKEMLTKLDNQKQASKKLLKIIKSQKS